MNRVVFVTSPNQSDGLTGALAGIALLAAVIAATMAGWHSGGLLLAILFGIVTVVTFPFLLTFGTILFLALYPVLAWPGNTVANVMGIGWSGPDWPRRMLLQRISVVLLLVPIFMLLQRNAVGVIALVAGLATFGLALLCLMIALPVLLMVGLILYALSQNRPNGDPPSTFHWTPPNPTRLPPPE